MQKVLGIVAVQLTLTLGLAILSSTNYDVGNAVTQLWVQLTALFVALFTLIVLLCVQRLRKQVPVNYILLLVFTLTEALAVSAWTANLTTESVLVCIGVLLASVLSLVFAALVTPHSAKLMKFLGFGLLIGIII